MQSAPEKQDPTPVEVNTDALQTSITTAEGKNQADYTEASWAALTEKLTAAKAALEAKESQEARGPDSTGCSSCSFGSKTIRAGETGRYNRNVRPDEHSV